MMNKSNYFRLRTSPLSPPDVLALVSLMAGSKEELVGILGLIDKVGLMTRRRTRRRRTRRRREGWGGCDGGVVTVVVTWSSPAATSTHYVTTNNSFACQPTIIKH